jgi:hypothetical protein
MATEQILIELVTDSTQLETAIEQLERLGVVDSKVAAGFKQASAEINKQTTAVKNVAGATKGNLDDLAKATKNVSGTFAQAFQDGVITSLMEAGVSVEDFSHKLSLLNETNPAFAQLSKSLTDTVARIKETATALEVLEGSGGAGTAAFAQLEDQLIKDQQELKDIVVQIDALKKATEDKGELPPLVPPGATEKVISLKTELKNLKAEIANAIATNQDYGESFDALVARAGHLDDAIDDASKSIKRAGSDTRSLDGLISITTGVAGGFAVAQGAAALFGDESEELQKTLLKVNAVMSIMQGLQAIQNVSLKESSALQLINTTATKAAAVAQRLYAFVVGTSTGALKVFRIALASTGIGLLIIALGALVANWNEVKEAIFGVSQAQKDLVKSSDLNADAEQEKLEALEGQEDSLKLQGKTERQILQAKVDQTNEIIAARKQSLLAQEELLKSQVAAAKRNREILAGILNFLSLPLNALIKTVNAVADFLGSDFKLPDVGSLASVIFDEKEVQKEGEEALKATRDEIKKLENQRAGFQLNINSIDKEAAEKRREEAKAANERRIKDQIALTEVELTKVKANSDKELELQEKLVRQKAVLADLDAKSVAERKLIATNLEKDIAQIRVNRSKNLLQIQEKEVQDELAVVKEGSQQELDLKRKLLTIQRDTELADTTITEEQKSNIREKYSKLQLRQQQEFNKKLAAQAIQDQISINNATLATLQASDEDRLLLQISNIELSAQAEIDAANGNAAKIKEIVAKSESDILEAKKNFLQDAFDYEMALAEKRGATAKRHLEELVDNERRGVRDRLDAIDELTDIEVESINKRKDHLRDLFKDRLITEKDYKSQYQDLENELTDILERAVKKRKAIINENTQKWIDVAIAGLQTIADVVQSLGDIQTARDSQRIDGERKALQEAKESGSITEKEAIARAKRIDAEERKLKTDAAKREKQAALFSAVLNVARAFANLLATTGGPQSFVLAALAAAAAAAQVAIIAAKPIPKFKSGKKPNLRRTADTYEGIAEVAEEGPEIIERQGKMYVVKEPSLTWLGAKDTVYTAMETKHILNKPQQHVNMKMINSIKADENGMMREMQENRKELKAIGKAIAKLPITTINFDDEGFKRSVQEGLSKINYNEKRYRFGS